MRYVVTGIAGFIGSHLAEALLARGDDVLGIDSFTDYYDPRLKEENAEGLPLLRLDLAEDPLEEAFAGVDGVFHLAGQPGVRSFGAVFEHYVRRNVLATQRVFEAAVASGAARTVFASSSSIYGEAERYPTPEDVEPRPLSPYGITKLTCEHLAHAYERSFGLDVVVLRYFSVYGPRQRPDMAFAQATDALAEARPYRLFGDGAQSRSFTYVDDVVAATLAAMDGAPAGAVLNVGGGVEATMNEALALLERISGRRLDVQRDPAVPGDQRRQKADTSRIRELLGWEPTTSLEQGVQAQWEWASNRVAAP
jgi:UDP-glucuronate 4-epimerase